MNSADLIILLKKVVEIVMPNLRKYYRVTRKAVVVKTYASDGAYFADVQPLRNDESVDENEPVISKIAIPVIWGGPNMGVVCPPMEGSYCDLSYYDGDPNYPMITNFRWHGNGAPACDVGGFIIQLEPGVSIEIDPDKNIVQLTPTSHETEVGKNWTITAGENVVVTAGESATIEAPEATVISPKITLHNNGVATGAVTMECPCNVFGVPHAVGSTVVLIEK